MNFDDITNIWQTSENHDVQIRNENALVHAVIRDYRSASIDRILNIAKLIPVILLAGFFFNHGYQAKPGHPVYDWMTWVYYVMGIIFLWIPVFYITAIVQQRAHEQHYSDSIKDRLRCTLSQVNHSIWINRTSIWWCILPLTAGLGLLLYRSLHSDSPNQIELYSAATLIAILLGIAELILVYKWTQRKVRIQHIPRKKRLEALLHNLEGERNEQ